MLFGEFLEVEDRFKSLGATSPYFRDIAIAMVIGNQTRKKVMNSS